MRGIVLFKLSWDGRDRSACASGEVAPSSLWNATVKTGFHEIKTWAQKSVFDLCSKTNVYKDAESQTFSKSRCNDDDWWINGLIILYFKNDSQREWCYCPLLVAVLRWCRGTTKPPVFGYAPQYCMMQHKLSPWINYFVVSIETLANREFACTITDDAWRNFHVWKFHKLMGRPDRDGQPRRLTRALKHCTPVLGG